jgi:hypothetical protein
MHFVAPRVESRYRTLLWFDAFGLALVTVAGTVKALDVGAPALVAIAMGAVTGSVGGIIRDTLGHVPSVLLRHEVYITASVLGACTYVGRNALGLARLAAMTAGFLVTFSVRGLAIKLGWSLPVFRESATRERWKIERKPSAGISDARVAAPDRFDDVLRPTKMERTQSKKRTTRTSRRCRIPSAGSSEEPLVTNGGTA